MKIDFLSLEWKMEGFNMITKKFFSFVSFVEKISNFLSVFFFSAMTIVMTYGVLNRNIFHLPGMWVIDLAGFCLVWFAFSAAAGAVPVFGNIKIPILIQQIPLKQRRYALIFIYVLNLAFTVSFFVISIPLVSSGLESKILTLGGISMFWPYLSLSFGSLVMSLSILKLIIKFIKNEDIDKYK